MKKVLFSLGVAVLLTALLTAPALAGVFYQTDMMCSFAGPFVPRGYAVVLSPSAKLYVNLSGLQHNTVFDVQITCNGVIFPPASRMSTPEGKLKTFVTAADLGLVPGQNCRNDIRITVEDLIGVERCTDGFRP
jgi:hypothetical protein